MPARKSSIGGARRGIQRAHIPYRGDNPSVGKKTGIEVRDVERKSDGFESFEEVMQQADGRTPPPLARARKKLVIVEEEDGNDGEISMELDYSPVPTNISWALSTSRLVALTPGTHFDRLPSPRKSPRKSIARSGPGSSRLSIASIAWRSSPEPHAIGEALQNEVDTNGFVPMDQDDDDGEGIEPFSSMPDFPDFPDDPEESPTKAAEHKRDKDKARGVVAPNKGHNAPHEAPEEEQGRADWNTKLKKGYSVLQDESNTASGRRRKPSKRGSDREGTRKSTREHIKPLEWWRGERYTYGRGNSTGPVLVPPIKEIIRIPKEPPPPLGSKRKRPSVRSRDKSKAVEQPPVMYNPEEGWDDKTPDKCLVLEYPSGQEKIRQMAFTARMFNPNLAVSNEWSYQRIFGDSEFIAAGQLTIPIAGRKPSKSSKDNTYVFYVAEGAVNFKVHNTSLILATGGMIMVPRGNTYYIENIAEREAKLVFTQARKIPPNEEEVQHQQMVNSRRSTDLGS